jgi:cytochrome c553
LLVLLLGAGTALSEPKKILAPLGSPMAHTEEDLAILLKLEQRVEEVADDPDAQKKIADAGKRRTILCGACHGKDGNSIRPEVPNLAGQNPTYIVDQFQQFSDGRRKDFGMNALGESFSEEEKILLALYYSELDVKPVGGGTPEQITEGKEIFDYVCVECHGADGRGKMGYARIAGQKPDYVIKMLKDFRGGGRRMNPWMKAVALPLTDEEITAIAMYISNMK